MIAGIRKYLAAPGLGPLLMRAVSGSAGLRIAGMGFGFLVGVQLARGLGADGYGAYGIAMSVIALLMVPTEFGLPQLVVRETAANVTKGHWGKVVGLLRWSGKISIVSWLLVSAIVVAVLALGIQKIDRSFAAALAVGLATIPLVAVGKTRAAALRGLSHVVKGQLPDALVRPGAQSILLFVAAAFAIPLTPALAMGTGAISAGLALLLAALMLRKALPSTVRNVEPEFDEVHWRSACVPMAMTEAMRIFQGHLAILMLGMIATSASVGNFKVATAVSVVVAVPIGILVSVAAPSISSLFVANDRIRLQKLLAWSSAAMVCGSAALSLPFFIAAPSLVELIFGSDFQGAATPLRILCLGTVLTATAGTAGTLLNMTGNERRVRHASFEALVVLALAMPPLILSWGATGAAIATVVSSLCWRARMARDCRRLLGMDPGVLALLRSWGK